MTIQNDVRRGALPWMLIIGGAIGLIASFALTYEDFQLALKGEDFVAGCDFGAVLTCTDVMQSDQASLFGFANPFIGLMAFPVLITTGVVMLAAPGTSHTRWAEWFWAGMQTGVTLGIVFVTWLQFQTIYRIEALCPWCMVVWAAVIPIFVHLTARNLRTWAPTAAISRMLSDWHLLITALWYIVIATAIVFKFYV